MTMMIIIIRRKVCKRGAGFSARLRRRHRNSYVLKTPSLWLYYTHARPGDPYTRARFYFPAKFIYKALLFWFFFFFIFPTRPAPSPAHRTGYTAPPQTVFRPLGSPAARSYAATRARPRPPTRQRFPGTNSARVMFYTTERVRVVINYTRRSTASRPSR